MTTEHTNLVCLKVTKEQVTLLLNVLEQAKWLSVSYAASSITPEDEECWGTKTMSLSELYGTIKSQSPVGC